MTATVYVPDADRLRGLVREAHLQKRHAAALWRVDHRREPDTERDWLWRAFRVGALWQQRQPWRDAIRSALDAAEADVPFDSRTVPAASPLTCSVLVDLRTRCGHLTPCPRHP